MDGVVCRGQHRTLDAVFQFADVAWPVIAHHHIDGGRGEPTDGLVVLGVHLADEMLRQHDDIRTAVLEFWKIDGEDVQAIVEVFAEFSLRHQFLQIPAGRGNDAHVALEFLVAAHPRKGALLDVAQKLDLHRQRDVADLVQKERSAIGGLGASDASGEGASEGALFVAKEFTFHQCLGQGRAIQGHEWSVLAWREIADGAGDQFLASSAGPAHQHRRFAGSDLTNQLINLAHRIAVAYQHPWSLLRIQSGAQPLVFPHQFFALLNLLLTGGDRICSEISYDFQKFQFALEIQASLLLNIHRERSHHAGVVVDWHTDEGHACRFATHFAASASTIQKAFVLVDVRNDFWYARSRHTPRDAFAQTISPTPLLLLGQPRGGLDDKDLPMTQCEGATKHSFATPQNGENLLQQVLHFAFVQNHRADFSKH